ncbi:MAG: 50S ribosomal protein L13 [Nitrospirae bacterium]|nr:50S ribosomal protein L13 [Nitrospirota bacterium]
MRTYMAKQGEIPQKWHLMDAEGQVLGRLATRVAAVLRGKHRPQFTPHTDTGDFVVVVNADKVRLTGKKLEEKVYYRHSNWPGGLKSMTAKQLLAQHPDRVITYAIQGMLPKNPLGRRLLSKLKVYPGAQHPHAAQRPEPLAV